MTKEIELQPMTYISKEECFTTLWRKKENIKFLRSVNYKGYNYHIVNMFNCWMCAYIEIEDEELANKIEYDYNLDIHWGVSYNNTHPLIGKHCIGWDYNHCDDYSPMNYASIGHKWTSQEVDLECRQVIDNLIKEINKSQKES